jgi:hypothetical protein
MEKRRGLMDDRAAFCGQPAVAGNVAQLATY